MSDNSTFNQRGPPSTFNQRGPPQMARNGPDAFGSAARRVLSAWWFTPSTDGQRRRLAGTQIVTTSPHGYGSARPGPVTVGQLGRRHLNDKAEWRRVRRGVAERQRVVTWSSPAAATTCQGERHVGAAQGRDGAAQ